MLETAVAIAREVRLGLRRHRLGRRVDAPLELSEHHPEQKMTPRRLGEGATVPGKLRELVARGVEAVGESAERPEGKMLQERDGGAPPHRWQRKHGGEIRV